MRQSTQLILGLVLATVAGTAGFLVARHTTDPVPAVEGLLWPDPPVPPAFAATDGDGRPFTNGNFAGRWSLLFFGFTHCPDVCPNTLAVLAQSRAHLEAATGGTPLQVVFVSVDPGRDNAEVVGSYVRYFDPAFVGVAGPGAMVLAQQTGVPVAMGSPGADGSYTVDHSASIFVVDPDGRLVGVIPAPHNPESVATRFRAITGFIRAQG